MICLQVKKLRRDYNEEKKNETMATKNIEKPISFSAESPNFKAGLKRTSTMAFERTGAVAQDFLEFFKTPMNTEPESRKNSSLSRERAALIDRFAWNFLQYSAWWSPTDKIDGPRTNNYSALFELFRAFSIRVSPRFSALRWEKFAGFTRDVLAMAGEKNPVLGNVRGIGSE